MNSLCAGGAAGHDACLDLVVGDGCAFHGASDEVSIEAFGAVSAVEAVGPFPEISGQVLGADAVMGADETRLYVAEDRMDDGEEFAGIGAPSSWITGVCFRWSPSAASRPW